MAMNTAQRGFTLLIAVIFTSVFLALALTIGSLVYKQEILASDAAQSQYAFYAADAALECALQVDQQGPAANNPFLYENHGKVQAPVCGMHTHFSALEKCYSTGACLGTRVTTVRIPLAYSDPRDDGAGKKETLCAFLTVYKQAGNPADGTTIFSQGYNVPCTQVNDVNGSAVGARTVTRGLYAQY